MYNDYENKSICIEDFNSQSRLMSYHHESVSVICIHSTDALLTPHMMQCVLVASCLNNSSTDCSLTELTPVHRMATWHLNHLHALRVLGATFRHPLQFWWTNRHDQTYARHDHLQLRMSRSKKVNWSEFIVHHIVTVMQRKLLSICIWSTGPHLFRSIFAPWSVAGAQEQGHPQQKDVVTWLHSVEQVDPMLTTQLNNIHPRTLLGQINDIFHVDRVTVMFS